ncbi:stage III sporulation protein AD [Thermovenabulum gondwanense]|uniref:Stage III sporulation protein AD n=1 Tax=Thermovenabulum gondwanense TaxID=520767 RepID=A0A161QAX6_9FIRM|nr:stage III sporulation protein AD [Thermovenabulum gondwanense]KYO65824.1 hypothetical protein ATZ99_14620 [Thermovenabulum gondwanense]
MEIIKIVGIGIVCTIFIVLLNKDRQEIAIQLSIVAGIVIFLIVLNKINSVIEVLSELASKSNIQSFYFTTILKIVGITYIAEFGAQICRDYGSASVASKIEFAAKAIIMYLSIPIIFAVVQTLFKIIP